jgi:AcrR family transcriptional regulator
LSGKEEQKAATRAQLRIAALSLFATKGYDATSASEIAALAGVSDRTFFLHFPTKADAIMGIPEDRLLELLREKIESDQSGQDDVEVLERALTAWLNDAGDRKVLHERSRLVQEAAGLSATVRGKAQDAHDAMLATAIRSLARRRGIPEPTLDMKIAATITLRVFQEIIAEWTRRAPNSFRSIAATHFEALRRIREPRRTTASQTEDPIQSAANA